MKKVNVNKVDVNKTNANNKKVTKSTKTETKTVQVELTTMQLYDDVSVTLETDTLADMEHWAYKTEDNLAYDLFDTARAYEDGQTEKLVPYSEDELNDMMVRAGLVANLFDDEDNEYGFNTHALALAIIKNCTILIGVLHGNYEFLKLN